MYNGWISLPPVLNYAAYTYKTGKMTLNWSQPTVNTDGSLISTTGATLAGYTIGYGNSAGVYTSFTNLSANLTSAAITIPTNSGAWFFAINASNVYGRVSAFSGEWQSGTSIPSSPRNFRMTP